jgi:nicotinate-nucleotide--dimethylbenzimidazole phosphoribosyltransferase
VYKRQPLGSLGSLEKVVALKVCQIQKTLSPQLLKPAILFCAGDHGITHENISPFPQKVTFQMVMNFLNEGAAINVFSRQHNINLDIPDEKIFNLQLNFGCVLKLNILGTHHQLEFLKG